MSLRRLAAITFGLVALLLLAFAAWFVPARLGMFATDRAAMVARYAQPPSRFITVDGVPMHVRVEGKGFPVLMLHGTGVNLHEWDPLAERLRSRYQVIRVDWPPYGLSGPNPKGYTTPEAARLVGLVLDRLGVKKVAVVATSNGSNVALQLNALEAGPAVRNNGGGHYNHAFFWDEMAPPDEAKKTKPSAALEAAINKSFGSLDEMKAAFEARAARLSFSNLEGGSETWPGFAAVGRAFNANRSKPSSIAYERLV
jgi:pimeloyl-ACP methyl ester carboxylesterase